MEFLKAIEDKANPPPPPRPQPQLVTMEDGSFAIQDGTSLTKIDSRSVPTVCTNEDNLQNTEVVGENKLLDYRTNATDQNVVQNECSAEWYAQYGGSNTNQ